MPIRYELLPILYFSSFLTCHKFLQIFYFSSRADEACHNRHFASSYSLIITWRRKQFQQRYYHIRDDSRINSKIVSVVLSQNVHSGTESFTRVERRLRGQKIATSWKEWWVSNTDWTNWIPRLSNFQVIKCNGDGIIQELWYGTPLRARLSRE